MGCKCPLCLYKPKRYKTTYKNRCGVDDQGALILQFQDLRLQYNPGERESAPHTEILELYPHQNSWHGISKGLDKKLEIFSASDVPDNVKTSKVATHLQKSAFRSQSGFDKS